MYNSIRRGATALGVHTFARRGFSSAAVTSHANGGTNANTDESSVRRGVQIGGVKGDGTTLRWYKQIQVLPIYKNSSSDATSAESSGDINSSSDNNVNNNNLENTGYTIYMDGKKMRTANERTMLIPSERLAKAVAVEWDSQDKHIKPTALPLTRMVTSALDLVADNRQAYIDKLTNALAADATCCREIGRGELGEVQERTFGPLFAWVGERFGAKPKVSDAFNAIEHPKELVENVRAYLASLDDYQLSALDQLAGTMKSVILAMALVNNKISVQEAMQAARVEEDFQTNIWGVVEGGHDLDRADMAVKVASATLMWRLLPKKQEGEKVSN